MWEVRECEYGKGVFAINDIPPLTLIGTYLGKQISREKYKLKKQSLQRYSDYCAEVPDNPNFLYDPTDNNGDISEEYKNNTPLYINEPPPHHLNNCCWVFNKVDDDLLFHLSTSLQIWTFREIKRGDQLFIFYGNDYGREYQINRNDNACGLPNHFNFSVKSKKSSSNNINNGNNNRQFVMDECPEWMNEIIDGERKEERSLLDVWKAGQHAQQLKNNPLLLINNCKDSTLIPFLRVLDTMVKKREREI